MKLYATVTSERATKGQGGEKLDIEIYGPKKNLLICVEVLPDEDGGITARMFPLGDSMLGKELTAWPDEEGENGGTTIGQWKDTKYKKPVVPCFDGYMSSSVKKRLKELRKELRAGTMSYGELAELQGLAEYIDDDDVELLEAAGVPEFTCRALLTASDGSRGYCPNETIEQIFFCSLHKHLQKPKSKKATKTIA